MVVKQAAGFFFKILMIDLVWLYVCLTYELFRGVFIFPKCFKIKNDLLLLALYLISLRSETMIYMRNGFSEIYWDLFYNLVHDNFGGRCSICAWKYVILQLDKDFYICPLNQAYFVVQLVYIVTNFLSTCTVNNWKRYINLPFWWLIFQFLSSILNLPLYIWKCLISTHRFIYSMCWFSLCVIMLLLSRSFIF